MDYSFDDIIRLLDPKPDYDRVRGKCRDLWNSFSPEKRQYIYCRIEEKKKRKEFVDYNPLLALKRTYSAPKPQIMSFNDYYAIFGTTEERDGWKMENPTGNKVIYVKHS